MLAYLVLGSALMVLTIASCTHEPTPITFPASKIGEAGLPQLSTTQRKAVRAVLAASTPADRPSLIVSFPPSFDPKAPRKMMLYYGDLRYLDGVTEHETRAYHVLGGGCNQFYYPYDGLEVAVPGEGGANCFTFKASAADRAARRYGLGT